MSTNSGLRRMVLGFRERLVSSDHNRLQSFLAADLADTLRHLLEADTRESQAGGVAAFGSTLTAPLRAVVLNGLRVAPINGTFNLTVEAGMAVCVSPESPANPDDSVVQLVRDPGQSVVGALSISSPGGGVRIDVVECSVSQLVTESDNRDVFNPGTGTFTPSLVNKVVEARMTYRVRAGTPGGGYPVAQLGWLPLAVVSVPSAATSLDDCTLWDVRPLASDMARGTHQVQESWVRGLRQQGSVIEEGSGNWRARGIFDLELEGRKLGGDLAPTAGGVNFLDLSNSGPNQEPGFAAVASSIWCLYLACPFGLPRWAKYSPSSGGARYPMTPRGIPILSNKKPDFSGKPTTAVALPTDTGLGGSTSHAVCAIAGTFSAGAVFCNATVSGGWTTHNDAPALLLAPATGAGTAAVTYSITGNVAVPAHVSAVRLRFTTSITVASGTVLSATRTVIVADGSGNTLYRRTLKGTETGPVSGSFVDEFDMELPLPPNLPTGSVDTKVVGLTYSFGGGSPTYSSQGAYVVGWKTLG